MLKELWESRKKLVESHLEKELREAAPLDKTLEEAMAYSLLAGGKRLRPILLMAAADAVGTDGTRFITTGCAIEMIHTY